LEAIDRRRHGRHTGESDTKSKIEPDLPEPAPVPLFERLLGASFEGLPAPIRRVHDSQARKVLSGRCRITRGTGVLARLLARVASLPEAGDDLPVQVLFQRGERSEIWSRDFAGQPMRSTLTERDGCLDSSSGQHEAVASLTPAPAKGGAGSIGTDQWMRPRSGMQSAGSPRAYARLHGHIPQAGPCSTFRRASPGGRGE